MKLLVCDYDNTLYINSLDRWSLIINVKAINKFRSAGNKFMIATGRPYNSITKEIHKHNIPIDYLSCCDGSLIFKKNHQIKEEVIDDKIWDFLSNLQKMYSEMDNINITSNNSLTKTEDRNTFIECDFLLRDTKRMKDIIDIIENAFPGIAALPFTYKNETRLYVRKKGISKSTSIDYVNSFLSIDKKNIFTIGDHLNDLEMLRDFNGFKMLWGKKELDEHVLGRYFLVSDLIDDIIKEKVKRR